MSYKLTREGGSYQPQGHTGIDYPLPMLSLDVLSVIYEDAEIFEMFRAARNADHETALIENTQRIITAEDGVKPVLIGGAL